MLEIKNIDKQYQNSPLLRDIQLKVNKAETLCLLGPSGSGKSTLLRIIAGLENPERGQVLWRGEDITDKPSHLRNFGLMFQNYALFPHMNVSENIAFGLRMKGKPEEEIKKRVREVLDLVHMVEFMDRSVTALSGGEQQRVALARAIAPEPALLLLDEPVGSLDRTLRERLLTELREVLQELETPVIYVTHDQEEAFSIADRLAVLHEASIIQTGTPAGVYGFPVNLWLAGFLGFQNRVGGRVSDLDPLTIQTGLGRLRPNEAFLNDFEIGDQVTLVIKPDGAVFSGCSNGVNCLEGKVADSFFSGYRYRVKFEMRQGNPFIFYTESKPEAGMKIPIKIVAESILCYKE